ncbi:hypothetical protein AGMMS50284_3210 [Clostridia bacterium]|nr:hypothetical protein AGMMS50284_3210 [Clostridia bacterium]
MLKNNKKSVSIFLVIMLIISMCMQISSVSALEVGQEVGAPTNITSSTNVNVKAGDFVYFDVKATFTKAISGARFVIYYDKDLFDVDETYGSKINRSDMGVLLPFNQYNGSIMVNTKTTKGEAHVTILADSGKSYTIPSDNVIATIRLIAKETKNGNQISYSMKELFAADGVEQTNNGKPATSNVSFDSSATVTERDINDGPMSNSKSIDVKKGDVVRYSVYLKTPVDLFAYLIKIGYDETLLLPDTSFGSGGAAVNDGIPYAIGDSEAAAPAIDSYTMVNFDPLSQQTGVRIGNQIAVVSQNLSKGILGYKAGKDAVAIQFIAQKDAKIRFTYYVQQLIGLDEKNYSAANLSGAMINGSSSDSKAVIIKTTSTTDPTGVVPGKKLRGDVNFDGVVDLQDVVLIQKKIAKLVTFTDEQSFFGDVTADKAVDLQDVVLIQKKIAKLVPEFGTAVYPGVGKW